MHIIMWQLFVFVMCLKVQERCDYISQLLFVWCNRNAAQPGNLYKIFFFLFVAAN